MKHLILLVFCTPGFLFAHESESKHGHTKKHKKDDSRFVIEYDITDIVKEKVEQHKKDKLVPSQPRQAGQAQQPTTNKQQNK